MRTSSKWLFQLAVVIGIAVQWIAAHHSEVLGMRPQGPHQWRQADCLSYTLNFTREDIPFTAPQVHNLGQNGTGKVVSEFPLLYFTVSRLWRAFGQHEWMYRLLVLALSTLGLFGLFYLLREFISKWWALFIVLLFASSPMHAYYSNNFLSNVPALSLALCGAAAHLRWERTGRWLLLMVSIAAFTLAGLFKISALLLYGALVGSMVLRWATPLLRGSASQQASEPDDGTTDGTAQTEKTQAENSLVFSWSWLALLLPLAINVYWYIWAKNFNEAVGNNGFFLIGILPIWEYSTAEIWENARGALKIWFGQYFFPPVQLFALLFFLPILWRWRRLPAVLRHLLVLTSLGMGVFIVLFFQVFLQHDYYLLDMMVVLPLVLAGGVWLWGSWLEQYRVSVFAAISLWGLSMGYLHLMMNHRYQTPWMNKHLNQTEAFETIEPWLRSKGVERTDPVLVWPARSINIPLYFMDQKGWTRFNTGMDDPGEIGALIDRGLKYLIIYDAALIERPDLAPYVTQPVGRYENIHVFWVGPGTFTPAMGPQMPSPIGDGLCENRSVDAASRGGSIRCDRWCRS